MTFEPDSIQVVAFDVHETLAYWPLGGPRKTAFAIQELLAEHGVGISYLSLLAARAMVIMHDAADQRIDNPHELLRAVFARLQMELPAELLDKVAETYQAQQVMELFEDSLEVVRAVHQRGLRTCTFTTLFDWAVSDVLAPLRGCLDEYFSSHRAGWPKGHPEFYRSVTRKLGVQPQQVLAIGDDPQGDVIIPTQVGWQCVHLQRRRRSNPPPEAVAAVGNLREFLGLLESS